MAQLDENAIRERARMLAAQGATEDEAALLRLARAEMERELDRHTRDAGEVRHRMDPPLEVDEALDPGLSQKPGGLKWASDSDERGAGG